MCLVPQILKDSQICDDIQIRTEPITAAGGFDKPVIRNQAEHLLAAVDQTFDIHACFAQIVLRPQIPDNLIGRCRSSGMLQKIYDQFIDLGRFKILFCENALGGDDLQFIKDIDDNVGVLLDNIRNHLQFGAVHQPFFVNRGYCDKSHHLQQTAAVQITLGVPNNQKAGGPFPEGYCDDGADTILFHKCVFQGRGFCDIFDVMNDHGGAVHQRIDPTNQIFTFLKITKAVGGHTVGLAVIPPECRPDLHGQISFHNACPVAVIESDCGYKHLCDNFLGIVAVVEIRFETA